MAATLAIRCGPASVAVDQPYTPVQRRGAARNAGDPAGGFHGLAFGVVALVYPDRSADMTLVHLAQPGIWLGEIGMMNEMPRQLTAIAHTDALNSPRLTASEAPRPNRCRLGL